jgi:hypothetical protein
MSFYHYGASKMTRECWGSYFVCDDGTIGPLSLGLATTEEVSKAEEGSEGDYGETPHNDLLRKSHFLGQISIQAP